MTWTFVQGAIVGMYYSLILSLYRRNLDCFMLFPIEDTGVSGLCTCAYGRHILCICKPSQGDFLKSKCTNRRDLMISCSDLTSAVWIFEGNSSTKEARQEKREGGEIGKERRKRENASVQKDTAWLSKKIKITLRHKTQTGLGIWKSNSNFRTSAAIASWQIFTLIKGKMVNCKFPTSDTRNEKIQSRKEIVYF